MATKLGLYNGALRALKQTKLASLTDDVEARHLIDDAYAGAISFCLEAGLWNFAQRTVMVEPDEDVEPSFGYSYVFTQPDDFVGLVAISDNESLQPTLDMYLDEGGCWHANVNPLYVSYVSDGASYGNNLGNWPETFARAVEHQIALEVGPHLTSMGEQALARLEKDARAKMRDALTKDAKRQPAMRPPPGRLVRARMGGFRFDQRRQNGR